MILYDIHTHTHTLPAITHDYEVRCILNVYPSDFHNTIKDDPNCYYSCGIHPWYCHNYEAQLATLGDIVKHPRVVAVGEVGLDKLKGPNMELQLEVFEKQIQLSIENHKPLIIHCVKAWDELIKLRKKYIDQPNWIIHGFAGNQIQVKQLCDHGFKISFGEHFNKEAVEAVPIDSIFCETDERRIEICDIYKNVAQARKISFDKMSELIAENSANAFF